MSVLDFEFGRVAHYSFVPRGDGSRWLGLEGSFCAISGKRKAGRYFSVL